jgi:SAM-dependent methyltransferase
MHFASYYRWLVYTHLFGVPASIPNLLDVGSDDGGFTERLPARCSVTLDISLAALRRASTSSRLCSDGCAIPLQPSHFDYVILSDVIEHVEDDAALLASVARQVRPGGVLWLSTTASEFQLFPPQITARAERSWGHVRKGYQPARLLALLGDDFEAQLIEWPEMVFRHVYLLMWACSKRMPALACHIAALCFHLDRRMPRRQVRQGHIYVQAVRHAPPNQNEQEQRE